MVAKVSIRHVPNQSTSEVIEIFSSFVEEKFKELKSCNNIKVKVIHTGNHDNKWQIVDFDR